jgi:antitoxin component YwqK of YwqJK toxin-antitoxin module
LKRYTLLTILLLSLLHGETIKTFYANGNVKSATSYKKGKKDGIEHIYYPDGATLKYAKSYEKGKLHGLQKIYRKNALLFLEESYSHGILNGKSRYYKNGLLDKEIIYQMGAVDKSYKEFYPTGLTKLEIIWDKGEPIEGYTYSQIGEAKAIGNKKLKELKLKEFMKSLPHMKK